MFNCVSDRLCGWIFHHYTNSSIIYKSFSSKSSHCKILSARYYCTLFLSGSWILYYDGFRAESLRPITSQIVHHVWRFRRCFRTIEVRRIYCNFSKREVSQIRYWMSKNHWSSIKVHILVQHPCRWGPGREQAIEVK